MSTKTLCLFSLCGLCLPLIVHCLPEDGKSELNLNKENNLGIFGKSLFKDSTVFVTGKCKKTSNPETEFKIRWRLYNTQCAGNLLMTDVDKGISTMWKDRLDLDFIESEQTLTCKQTFYLKDETNQTIITVAPTNITDTTVAPSTRITIKPSQKIIAMTKAAVISQRPQKKKYIPRPKTKSPQKSQKSRKNFGSLSRQKRAVLFPDLFRVKRDDETETELNEADDAGESKYAPSKSPSIKAVAVQQVKKNQQEHQVKKNRPEMNAGRTRTVLKDAIYIFVVWVEPSNSDKDENAEFTFSFNVQMKDKNGHFLSAIDWPLLPFYGVMSLLYLFLGLLWLVVSACQWRDLLRIQFWIGGVIALGMLEKAVFYAEYNGIYYTGDGNTSLLIFAELVSSLKRTLARMLIIIVSMGFGIVKPRLGGALHRVLGVGAIYFILSAVEGCFRAVHPKTENGKGQLIASIPLAVLDSAICWWIFMSLVQTTRTLRIRRNVVKLTLYKHFTNTLIFAVLASVVYMIWSIKTRKFASNPDCIADWGDLWLDEAFWHFLFSLILIVIMILWRPTANNQRYAFTPLVDIGEDDDDNMTLSEAFEGMKMRNTQREGAENGDSKSRKKIEDDLKWVEENIPTSAADTALPSLLDSDEELMTRKYEISKME